MLNTLFCIPTYLNAGREKFPILKNGSDHQGGWSPLMYYIFIGFNWVVIAAQSIVTF